MSLHGLVDRATVRLSGTLLGSNRFFADGLESPPLVAVAAESGAALDAFDPEGVHPVTVETPVGEFEAAYRAVRWVGPTAPTVLFHHGSGENPFGTGPLQSTSVDRIFDERFDVAANVVAVRAPFHDRSSRAYAKAMGDLSAFVGMVASSSAVVEALAAALHEGGSAAVVVSGISLGGWVTNVHRAVSGSAELYAPIFAGDRLGEMFVSSVYRAMTGERARANPDRLRAVLDFDAAFREAEAPVSGLLARHDAIIEYGVQRWAFRDEALATIDDGHVTGSLASGALREHVERAIRTAPGHGR